MHSLTHSTVHNITKTPTRTSDSPKYFWRNLNDMLKQTNVLFLRFSKNTPLVNYRRGRNLNDMLCSQRIPQQKDTNQRNKYSQDVNNKSEKESQPKTNQCPECGILLKNEKGLKIHRSSKHRRQQNGPTSPGFWPCKSDSRCDTCRRGHFCTSVESSKNGRKHQIQQPLTCKSKNICYLIHCKHCNQQYTGETKLEFHLRLNNHTSDIKLNKKNTEW